MGNKLDVNPWIGMWLRPRETIRAVMNYNPKFRFVLLSIFYGLPMAYNMAQNYSLGDRLPLWAIVLGGLLLSGFMGALAITIGAALFTWTGRWIGGKGNFDKVRCALAWSSGVPNTVVVAIWAILIAIFGSQAFSRMFAETVFVGYQAGVVFLVFLIESIVWVWGFVMLFKSLGEAHGFSSWKAVLNVLIAFIIIFALIWFVGGVFWGQTQVSIK
jgi:hypothetical protein